MRDFALSSIALTVSKIVTSWPASANTCAMPWPIKPAPMTAILGLAMSARRIAAVGVEDVAGVEVGGFRGQEQQRPCEVRGLAQAAFRHAGEEARAHCLAAL